MSKETLTIPSMPHHISNVAFHALMKMIIGGKPVIGMKIGSQVNYCLLIIEKDGSVRSIFAPRGKADDLCFLDYLTEEDSVEIFGSMKLDSSNIQSITPVELPIIPNMNGREGNYEGFPDCVPFRTGKNTVCMLVSNHPYCGEKKRVILILSLNNDGSVQKRADGVPISGYDVVQYMRTDRYFERTYKFFSGPHMEFLEEFKNHLNIKNNLDALRASKSIPEGW